jgi:hypothetical protein
VGAAIRDRHQDLPAVVMVMASGTIGAPAGTVRLDTSPRCAGTTRTARGSHPTARGVRRRRRLGPRPDRRPGHPAARGRARLVHIRRIKDTSRQGRYHNHHFAHLATSFGLHSTQTLGIGWSTTNVPTETVTEYADTLTALDQTLTIHRRAENNPIGSGSDADETGEESRADATDAGQKNQNPLPCLCECGRRHDHRGRCRTDFAPALPAAGSGPRRMAHTQGLAASAGAGQPSTSDPWPGVVVTRNRQIVGGSM